MPWRGPETPGEFPTLGYLLGEWIEEHVVIPDGDLTGQPYKLTDEMWNWLVRYYRLEPYKLTATGRPRFHYRGGQLMRSQKWGKGPFAGAQALAEGLGPALPDGWDADGEPVGRPWPTPLIQITAVSEDQADNVFRALLGEIREGPLAYLDAGETRINLPGGGRIDPVTASAKSRLGQRVTFVVQDETHLWTEANSMVTLANNQRRGAAGMGGRWAETTNAYDPAERSVAQRTHEGKSPGVLLDHRTTRQLVDLADRRALMRALSQVYGDSWWVDLERVADEVTDPSTLESDARRYFLSEIVAGQDVFVDALQWAAMERSGPEFTLKRKDRICLGFDGSKTKDATALVGCRLSDGHLFHIQTWERPRDLDGEWRIPSADVDRVMANVFDVYRVVYLFADPWKWQDYIDAWAGRWPKRVVEFPTNVETRMDRAIERFRTAFDAGQITHDGAEVLTRHVNSTVVTKGKRKTPRDDESGAEFYLKLAKRKSTVNIDTAVAAVLAYAARGQAVEDGWLKRSADPLKTIY
jgi:hypothetical protein